MASAVRRRLRIGAETQPGGGAHFRVWAPRGATVEVVVLDADATTETLVLQMVPEGGGYFSAFVPGASDGTLYRFRIDRDGPGCADPASRFQPFGPAGPSRVVDPAVYRWRDDGWAGLDERQVVYEMHVGTFTFEGTWDAAAQRLPDLADIGVTTLEVMPVAEFAGEFGWGYDGVDLFAPTHLYGEPDDFRAFVDTAHRLGLAVLLDVVYNHFGPEGSVLQRFAGAYTSDVHRTEWGAAVNFDGADSSPVREFFTENARYWIEEYHLDGLRVDATQNVIDGSREHILRAITRTARRAAASRRVWLIAENEPQDTRLVRTEGFDALWNDDFHHSAMVAMTGRAEAYYTDYRGEPQEFVSLARHGYLYQGQSYAWQKKPRGTPAGQLPRSAFVNYLENHDQVANSGHGERLHQLTAPGLLRAMTALLLLLPGTPMLFQGQEFAASSPFLYFADHRGDMARTVGEGRARFLAQFPSLATAEAQSALPDPSDPATFERCKLNHAEREAHAHVLRMHRDLLALRRHDPVLGAPGAHLDGAVLGQDAFVIRFWQTRDGSPPAEAGGECAGLPPDASDTRLLVVNLGHFRHVRVLPEPLLAPPPGHVWQLLWASEAVAYGGPGMPPPIADDGWRLPACAAFVLRAHRESSGSSRSTAASGEQT